MSKTGRAWTSAPWTASTDWTKTTTTSCSSTPKSALTAAACEPVCPVTAIFAEDDVPPEWDNFIDINYEYFGMER